MNARKQWDERSRALFAVAVFLALILAASAPGGPPVDPGAQAVGGFDDQSPTVDDSTINWSLQARADGLLARVQGAWHLSIDGTMGGRPVSYTGTLQADGTWNPALPCGNAHPLGVDLIAPLASPEFVVLLRDAEPEVISAAVSWDAGRGVVSWFSVPEWDMAELAYFNAVVTTRVSRPAGLPKFTVPGLGQLDLAELVRYRLRGGELDDATVTVEVEAEVEVNVPPFATVRVKVKVTIQGPSGQMQELIQKAQEAANALAEGLAARIRAQLEALRDSLKQALGQVGGGLKKFFEWLLY